MESPRFNWCAPTNFCATVRDLGLPNQASASNEFLPDLLTLKFSNVEFVNGSTPRTCRYSPGQSGNVTTRSTNGVAAVTPGIFCNCGNKRSSSVPRTSM